MRINLNDYITVRLTTTGEQAWSAYWQESHNGVPPSVREAATLPDGRVRFQLWVAMATFGPRCLIGGEPLFADNEVEVDLGKALGLYEETN